MPTQSASFVAFLTLFLNLIYMYRYLLLLVVLLTAYCLYINLTPGSTTEGFTNLTFTEEDAEVYTPVKEPEVPLVSPEETNLFLKIWNGYYPYSGTKPGNQKIGNFLEISMKDQDRGVVSIPNTNHWLVRSYGPTVLQGDSYDKSSSIYLEMLGDWRHASEQLPKVNIRVTDNKTGKVSSLSSSDSSNLNAYSTKVINVLS